MTKLIPAGVGNSIAARCFAPITIEWLKNIWPPPCLNRIGTKGFMDGISMEPPNLTSLNINRMEEEVDGDALDLMRSDHGS